MWAACVQEYELLHNLCDSQIMNMNNKAELQ